MRKAWIYITHHAFPNQTVFLVFLTAICLELAWLMTRVDGLCRTEAVMIPIVVTYTVWFWFTLVYVLHGLFSITLCTGDAVAGKTLRKYLLSSLFIISTLIATYVYAVSWGVYFQTGRFANWESLRFFMANTMDLWFYVSTAERIQVVKALVLLSVFSVAWLYLPQRMGQRSSILPSKFSGKRIWVWLTIGTCLSFLAVMCDRSYERPKQRIARIETSLHPTYTLVTSAFHSVRSGAIEPTLDTMELTPLSASWSAPITTNESLPSIIFVAVESLRQDVIHSQHQGQAITPNINQLASGGLEWRNAYAQSTHSDYADVCIVSSLYPLRTRHHLYYSNSDPWPKTLIYDVLKQAGYKTAIISSQNEAWGK